MNSYENPMAAQLTDAEEWQMLSEEDIDALPDCSWCGEKVLNGYRKSKMHKACWLNGKAEYDISRGRDE